MNNLYHNPSFYAFGNRLLAALRLITLILSVALIVYLSVLIFTNSDYKNSQGFLNFQFWVCIMFMADFIAGLIFTANPLTYISRNFLFLIISVPYTAIAPMIGWHPDGLVAGLLPLLPVARSTLAMSIILGYLSHDRISSLFASYLTIMMLIAYFSILVFFQYEHPVNSAVASYSDAVWWGLTTLTTLGCDLFPITVQGRIASVILSMMGLLMLPLFTVYFSNLITHNRKPQ